MGIEPKIFGPSIWGAMHYIALGAPDKINAYAQGVYRTFYMSLPQLIPCTTCATHFSEVIEGLPIDAYLDTSAKLFEWTVKAHNIVNRRLNKPEISVEDARKIWMSVETVTHTNKYTNNTDMYSILTKIICILTIFILGYIVGKYVFTKEHKKR